jgi:hypothetical protein
VFTPKKSDAEELFDEFPRGYPVRVYCGKWSSPKDGAEDESHRIGITHSLGPLGTSISRHRDQICVVDCAIFLPRFAYQPGVGITSELIQKAYSQKATDVAIQNLGRILRKNPDHPGHRKVVLLHNSSDSQPDLEVIRAEVQKMCKKPVTVSLVEKNQEYLLAGIYQYLETGRFLEMAEKTFETERIKTEIQEHLKENPDAVWHDISHNIWAIRELSKEARVAIQVWFENLAKNRNEEGLLEKIEDYLKDNPNAIYRDVYHKFNLDRQPKETQELIKTRVEDKLKTRVAQMAVNTIPWCDVYDQLHLERYPEVIKELKNLYDEVFWKNLEPS